MRNITEDQKFLSAGQRRTDGKSKPINYPWLQAFARPTSSHLSNIHIRRLHRLHIACRRLRQLRLRLLHGRWSQGSCGRCRLIRRGLLLLLGQCPLGGHCCRRRLRLRMSYRASLNDRLQLHSLDEYRHQHTAHCCRQPRQEQNAQGEGSPAGQALALVPPLVPQTPPPAATGWACAWRACCGRPAPVERAGGQAH